MTTKDQAYEALNWFNDEMDKLLEDMSKFTFDVVEKKHSEWIDKLSKAYMELKDCSLKSQLHEIIKSEKNNFYSM